MDDTQTRYQIPQFLRDSMRETADKQAHASTKTENAPMRATTASLSGGSARTAALDGAWRLHSDAEQAIPARAMHGHVTVYRCEVCRLWHIGSHLSPKRRDRRAAAAEFSRDIA